MATWLDGSPVADWNNPGVGLPIAPAPTWTPPAAQGPGCQPKTRAAVTAEDGAVASKGWSLFRDNAQQGSVTIVWGMASVDGMCRPMQYQAFVFVSGTFAGTLAPAPMDSRSDGALDRVEIAGDGGAIAGTYRRYSLADPRCCPSRTSTLTFAVDLAAPLVTPLTVRTTPNATPPAASPPGASPSPGR